MKKFAFGLTSTAALALSLAACNKGNQDVVSNAEMNQPSPDLLNEQANQAALDAANAQAAATQQPPSQDQNAAGDANNPNDAEEQNVSGM